MPQTLTVHSFLEEEERGDPQVVALDDLQVYTIGRSRDPRPNHYILVGAARFISAIHVTLIRREDGRWEAHDGDGEGHPSVNGALLNKAVLRDDLLQDGDVIEIPGRPSHNAGHWWWQVEYRQGVADETVEAPVSKPKGLRARLQRQIAKADNWALGLLALGLILGVYFAQALLDHAANLSTEEIVACLGSVASLVVAIAKLVNATKSEP